MRTGGTGVAGAAFVLAAVLVAAPLYVASVGSAGLQRQFDERCPARIGLLLPPSLFRQAGAVRRAAEPALAGASNLEPPIRTTWTRAPLPVAGLAVGVADAVRLMHRQGGLDDVEVLAGPEGDGAWIPASWAGQAGLEPGSTVRIPLESGSVDLAVAAVYRDLVGVVPPRAWCTQSDVLAPTPQGDPPPPLLLLDDATLAALPVAVSADMTVRDQFPVRRTGLTTGIARDLVARFEPASAEAESARLAGVDFVFVGGIQATSDLPAVLRRAEGIGDLVRANVTPVRIAGAIAATTLALAAGLLATRRRRPELTTRAVRGEGPARLSARIARGAAGPAVLGAVAGGIAALVAVRAAGPAPDLGPIAGTMVLWIAVAAFVTLAAATVAGAGTVRRLADPAPVHHHRRLAWVPWELAVGAVVVGSALRLDDVGGAQFVASQTTNADGFALAFPMLAATGVALLLLRPAAFAARRLRRAGAGADAGVTLGIRRLAYDPAAAAAVTAAVALASATAVLGGVLSASAAEALRDKATTFVGADVAVTIGGPVSTLPPSLHGRATLTRESRAESGSQRAVVLGVDPATFAAGATTDDDVLGLLRRLGPPGGDGAAPAIVVGPLPDRMVELGDGTRLQVRPVARPAAFPTSRSSSTLVVVRRDVLDGTRSSAVVLAQGGAADVEHSLRDAGLRVGGVVSVEEVATGTSLLAVEWAYAALRALGAVVVVVIVGVLLARSAARARLRQLAEVFTAAMGLGHRRAVTAEVVENGLPMAVGLAAGLITAVITAAVAVPRLDSARILPPGPVTLVPSVTLLSVVGVAGVALVVVVAAARRQAQRARSAVVLRDV